MFGAVISISSASFPQSTISTLSSPSIEHARKAPGRSATATSRPSHASITAVTNTASRCTVGDAASSLGIVPLYFLPSATRRPFTESSLLCLTVMIASRAARRCSGESSEACFGTKVFLVCTYKSSLPTAFSARPGNFFSAVLKLYCIIT